MGRLLKANALALLILALLVGVYYFPHTSHVTTTTVTVTVTPTPISTLTPYASHTTTKTVTITATVTTTVTKTVTTTTTVTATKIVAAPTVSTLVDAVLAKINEERQKFGVPPVSLFNDAAARFRAEDMYSNNYFGHCDLSGLTPNYHYTRLGGTYVIEENLGYSFAMGGSLKPVDAALEHVNAMIYDDAESNWGHRDSLLDPTNNFASIYAIWDDRRLFLAIHMMKIWVEWIRPPTIRNGVFVAEGTILLNDSKLETILIYYSRPNTLRFSDPLRKTLMTCSSYSVGEPIAGVVPEPYYYPGIKTVRPLKWEVRGQYFSVEFPVDFTDGRKGIYTIVIWAKNTLHITHPFNEKRYRASLPILEYAFLVD